MTTKKVNTMLGVNSYGRELSQDDIETNVHRGFVGGMWAKIGKLQLDFLVAHGLRPSHRLLDIGCGCLRGGVQFINYLDTGKYFGIDVNSSLVQAGIIEINKAALGGKKPNLLVDDQFRFHKFGVKFDYMVSISLFTHLPMNIIIRCLAMARSSLNPGGLYFATFFEAPYSAHLENIKQSPGDIITKYDADPFHYSFDELSWMGSVAGLHVELIGDWNHPRNQKMAVFSVGR